MPPRREPTAPFHVGETIRAHYEHSVVEGVIQAIKPIPPALFYILQDGTLIHDGAQPIELVLARPSERALRGTTLTTKQSGMLLELARNKAWRTPRQVADALEKQKGMDESSPGDWGSCAKLIKELMKKGLVRVRMNGYYFQKPWPRWEYRVSDAGERWLVVHQVGETRESLSNVPI